MKMNERKSSAQFLTSPEGRIDQAKNRYQELLDHRQIWPRAQEAAWSSVERRFGNDPEAMIEEIDDYWEEEFGSDSDEKTKGPGQSNRSDMDPEKGLSRAESVIYKKQSEHWQDDRRIQRAGSKRKAGF